MAHPKHAKYNASKKGQDRNKRYEEAHPERRNRLRTGFVARDAMRGGGGDGGNTEGPAHGRVPNGGEGDLH